MSKSLTATGVLVLVAQGKLRTDQPIASLLPTTLPGSAAPPRRSAFSIFRRTRRGFPIFGTTPTRTAARPYRLRPDGGAGFFSSLHDLLRYALFHLARLDTAVPRSAAVTSALPATHSGFVPPGLGLIDLPGATVLLSDGRMAGGTSVVLLVPEADLGIVAHQPDRRRRPRRRSPSSPLSFPKRVNASLAASRSASFPCRGIAPSGSFEGWIGQGEERAPIALDVPAQGVPTLQFGEGAQHLVQDIA